MGAVVQLVEYQTRNRQVAGSIHTRSTASNLQQVANLLCAQAHSASYPQRDGKWVVATATGWRPSVANWGDGVQLSVSPGSGWPHNALWHHWLMLISCHFRDSCKWCYSRCPDLHLLTVVRDRLLNAVCPSVLSFNCIIPRVQSFIISYLGFRFTTVFN